uniref:Uncharacterized protein n=1 Tax=Salix viminalis TaxID=40686 RepID=A0A6N2KGB8_SALVM
MVAGPVYRVAASELEYWAKRSSNDKKLLEIIFGSVIFIAMFAIGLMLGRCCCVFGCQVISIIFVAAVICRFLQRKILPTFQRLV